MHFAAFIQVGESVKEPAKYYQNNFAGTLVLLQAMLNAQVKHFIFSSTAAVYGEPQYTPIDENHPIAPINPYGRSKWMVEQVLRDYAASYGLKFAALRYFNAAGADPSGALAERHDPETHLIPLVLQVASGHKQSITIYGDDYPTPDGTCVRDYIHVNDLCDAHLLALQALWNGAENASYNLGTGQGFSVQQVIDTAREVTDCDIAVTKGERREGDPAVLVADATFAMEKLGWQPKYSDLKTIIQHAWQSELNLKSVTPA
jgi:UDP-glucose 4-epimerase